jgi:hypothetical protein
LPVEIWRISHRETQGFQQLLDGSRTLKSEIKKMADEQSLASFIKPSPLRKQNDVARWKWKSAEVMTTSQLH